MRYILSQYISFVKNVVPEAPGGHEYFLDITFGKQKSYLVNKSIYDFAQHFKAYNTLDDVVADYAAQMSLNSDNEQLNTALSGFFKELLKFKVLVTEGEKEPQIIYEPVYNEGDQIDEYTVVSCLANNKTTDVYLVTDQKQEQYIIKLLNTGKITSEKRLHKYIDVFEGEFRFLEKFNSDYINRGFRFHESGNNYYFVIEYIEGTSLGRYIDATEIPLEEKNRFIKEIAKAFAVVHNGNVYHGDIHFGNVIITLDGNVKIIDFGLANDQERVAQSEHTQERVRNGGVNRFIPPERLIVGGPLGKKFTKVTHYNAEVYQIGLLFYAMFVGKLPFISRTWKQLIDEKLVFDVSKDESFINAQIPEEVRAVIIKCLSVDPATRYQTAQELSDYLEKAL